MPGYKFQKILYSLSRERSGSVIECLARDRGGLFLPLQTVQILMKYSIMLHFIWVFAVCKNARLGISQKQGVNLQHSICKYVFSIRVESIVDPDLMALLEAS